ncbi:hypothetical protein RJ639_034397 [Escallonia herrerae]|uniref:MADS-box domain-containing protein n=1 Tax=Escallonia herrerae TaxID=1293975 RepID=A0AA89BE55_9ASTE|nr:hypothetical protein RJ639_034397 [Escallonia herrerae]
MGRRRVEMKRIEDKSSRQVTFSKRRGGLMKKARELSVLCGVDVSVVVFSCRGKLYDFCSGTDRSVFFPALTCLRICSSLDWIYTRQKLLLLAIRTSVRALSLKT